MIHNSSVIQKRDNYGYHREISRLSDLKSILGIHSNTPDALLKGMPFSDGDITAGSENELQVAVIGSHENVDLPITIKESSYYKNIIRRAASRDASSNLVDSLDSYLEEEGKKFGKTVGYDFLNVFSAGMHNVFLSMTSLQTKQILMGLKDPM